MNRIDADSVTFKNALCNRYTSAPFNRTNTYHPTELGAPPVTARRVLLFVFAGALALVTARGGSSGSSNSQPTNSPAAQTSSAQSAPSTASNSGGGSGSGSNANGIPQNNGGDHDGDNNGGPSDGDGNL